MALLLGDQLNRYTFIEFILITQIYNENIDIKV